MWPAAGGGWEPRRPGEIPLRRDEVQVWLLSLVATPEQIAKSTRLLSADERERARRFRLDRHRWRWIQARAHSRRLLGAYLACPPEDVELALDARGKPSVRGPLAQPGLELNLSHSGDLALFAVALGRRVGVDVEVTRPRLDVEVLAARVLSECERAPLRGLSGCPLELQFLRCWTRKEAWIKALGEGLARDLQSFEVLPGESAGEREASAVGPPGDSAWWLQDLTLCPGAVGCLAAEGSRPEVRLLTVPEESSS